MRPHIARGFCKLHYTRASKGADLTAPLRSTTKSDWRNSGQYHCPSCDTLKPLSSFYFGKNCRPSNRCKECQRKHRDAWHIKNAHRWPAVRRKWRLENRDKQLQWRSEHPGATTAWSKVKRAVEAKRIAVPLCCPRCGATGELHAHHENYSRPLDVTWLCPSCHRRHHMSLGERNHAASCTAGP